MPQSITYSTTACHAVMPRRHGSCYVASIEFLMHCAQAQRIPHRPYVERPHKIHFQAVQQILFGVTIDSISKDGCSSALPGKSMHPPNSPMPSRPLRAASIAPPPLRTRGPCLRPYYESPVYTSGPIQRHGLAIAELHSDANEVVQRHKPGVTILHARLRDPRTRPPPVHRSPASCS